MVVHNQDASAAHWRKSSLSAADGNCVEVALNLKTIVAIRDSKHPTGPILTVDQANWCAFMCDVRNGVFDIG
jgi:Domain of unknown function (DUF397)